MILGCPYAADVEIGDVVVPSDAASLRAGRRVVRKEGAEDSLTFHYEDDGESETYDAKVAVLVNR